MSRSYVLLGMKHCGKSTHGRLLAEHIGGAFIDTDDVVESIFAETQGEKKTCREIYRDHGARMFYDVECEAIRALVAQNQKRVIALGGGTAMHEELHPLIREMGTVVYLANDPEELYKRVMAGGIPPFLDADDPHGSFMDQVQRREAAYCDLAEVRVDLHGQDIDEAQALLRVELGL
ncbi:MAG: hypothetical protein HN909_02225 [Phycisphaerales bacterium]|jgi:shikimate kinase|nr:hypothetical protein [Phycisphaerales bacterium]MBT7170567.1 hypothetical protein [Phycisphaerales bacterium]